MTQNNHPVSRQWSLSFLFLEVFLIILGVFLGLIANEWRISRADGAQAEKDLASIRKEIELNLKQLEGILPYHRSMNDSLRVLSSEVINGNDQILFSDLHRAMPRGFSVPLIDDTAWQLANRSGTLQHVDRKAALTLSQLYRLQDFYQGKLDRISENLYVAGNIHPESLGGLAMALSLLANDIVIHEDNLVEFYTSVLSRLAADAGEVYEEGEEGEATEALLDSSAAPPP